MVRHRLNAVAHLSFRPFLTFVYHLISVQICIRVDTRILKCCINARGLYVCPTVATHGISPTPAVPPLLTPSVRSRSWLPLHRLLPVAHSLFFDYLFRFLVFCSSPLSLFTFFFSLPSSLISPYSSRFRPTSSVLRVCNQSPFHVQSAPLPPSLSFNS